MKRYVAPMVSAIAAAILIVVFGFFYYFIFKEIPGTGLIQFVFIAVGILIAVLLQRIKEIKEGEEDDLGKY